MPTIQPTESSLLSSWLRQISNLFNKLIAAINKHKMAQSRTFIIFAGDLCWTTINKSPFNTREPNRLVHCYMTIKNAYRSISVPHFRKSDHLALLHLSVCNIGKEDHEETIVETGEQFQIGGQGHVQTFVSRSEWICHSHTNFIKKCAFKTHSESFTTRNPRWTRRLIICWGMDLGYLQLASQSYTSKYNPLKAIVSVQRLPWTQLESQMGTQWCAGLACIHFLQCETAFSKWQQCITFGFTMSFVHSLEKKQMTYLHELPQPDNPVILVSDTDAEHSSGWRIHTSIQLRRCFWPNTKDLYTPKWLEYSRKSSPLASMVLYSHLLQKRIYHTRPKSMVTCPNCYHAIEFTSPVMKRLNGD